MKIKILFITIPLLAISSLSLLFILVATNQNDTDKTLGVTTEKTSNSIPPTPTPKFHSFKNEPPSYVATVSAIPSDRKIVLDRDDSSQIILELNPNIQIHIVDENLEDTQTATISEVQVGDTVSIYSEGSDIHALFILRS